MTQFKCPKTGKILEVRVHALVTINRGTSFPELAPAANTQSECIVIEFDHT